MLRGEKKRVKELFFNVIYSVCLFRRFQELLLVVVIHACTLVVVQGTLLSGVPLFFLARTRHPPPGASFCFFPLSYPVLCGPLSFSLVSYALVSSALLLLLRRVSPTFSLTSLVLPNRNCFSFFLSFPFLRTTQALSSFGTCLPLALSLSLSLSQVFTRFVLQSEDFFFCFFAFCLLSPHQASVFFLAYLLAGWSLTHSLTHAVVQALASLALCFSPTLASVSGHTIFFFPCTHS